MLYFIPAWYSNNDWKENEQAWYRARTVTEFDDTVKQIQLFFRKKVADFKILVLGFSPDIRHFLHRQGVYHAPYWSCFDSMQGIRKKDIQVFSYHELNWPDGVEFIYSPFAVIALLNGKKYAVIEFAEDGNMFRVDMYQDEVMVSRNLYDDRGFISCQIVFRNGLPYREQYFNEDGVWKFARFLDDGHTIINPDSNFFIVGDDENEKKITYRKKIYNSIDEMIMEVFLEALPKSEDDIFIIAMDRLHSGVILKALEGRKKILSFFNRRLEEGLSEYDDRLIEQADYIVLDKKETEDDISDHLLKSSAGKRIITPYDSRVEFSDSQHLRVQNTLFAVDGLNRDEFDDYIVKFAEYQKINKRARMILFTRSSNYDARRLILHNARKALRKAGMDPEIARENNSRTENSLDMTDDSEQIFFVSQCVDEMSVSRTLREQRVVIDLNLEPDQFLQISAMSMGIPQITLKETDYIEDGKNGKVIKDKDEFIESIKFYLESIENYNAAEIASYELGSKFSTNRLVDSWKEVIKDIEH